MAKTIIDGAKEIEAMMEREKSLVDEFIKREFFKSQICHNFIRRAETWSANYQQLDSSEQERLKDEKEGVEKILQRLKNQQKVVNELPLENPWPWTRVIKWGGGTVVLVLVVIWIIKKIFSLWII